MAAYANRFVPTPGSATSNQSGVGTNRYAYAGNDPINRLDPNGNIAPAVVVVGAVVGVAILVGGAEIVSDAHDGEIDGDGAIGQTVTSIVQTVSSNPPQYNSEENGSSASGNTNGSSNGDPEDPEGNVLEASSSSLYEKYKDELRAEMEKPVVKDPTLSRIMNYLYRAGAKVGSGSTAAAVRNEIATGQPTAGKFHTQKAHEGIRALDTWLSNNPNAAPGDIAAAKSVIRDMTNALAGN